MHNQTELWGEYFNPQSSRSLTQQEKETLAWVPKPLALEGPRIHQPVGGEKSSGPMFASPLETQIQDEWVLGGLKLLNYQSEVQGVIDGVHRIKDHAMPVPPLPPQVVQPVRTRGKGLFSRFSSSSSRSPSSSSSNNLVNHNADDIEHKVFDVKPNVTGNNAEAGSDLIGGTESPPLSATVVRQLMHKSVAAILAFYGFEQSTDESLNVMTDVACDFMRQFCTQLRQSRDNQLTNSASGFTDVMERTYRDMNLGSILDLRDFYNHDVIGRYSAIRRKCERMADDCAAMQDGEGSIGGNTSSVSGKFIQQAYTPGSMDQSNFDNVPEIHFPSSDEADSSLALFSLEHSTPQMETGLQMLQSLEQGNYSSVIGNSSDDHLQHHQPLSQESSHSSLPAAASPSRKRKKT